MASSLRFSVFHSDLNDFLSPRSVINSGMPLSRNRGARADDRSMSMPRPQRSDDVALAQRSPRASANAREFGRVERVGQYADQEIFSRCDVALCLPLGRQYSPAFCDRAATRLPLRAPLQCAGIP
jgi:hypothetical protein